MSRQKWLQSLNWLRLVFLLGSPLVSANHLIKATGTSQGTQIVIDPPAPTPNDTIQIAVSGEWPNVCVPRYQSHQIVGKMIRIEAEATLFGRCIALEEPGSWSFIVEVGPLPIGLYTVEVYLVDSSFWGRPPILYGTTSFLVSTERLYLPVILRSY